MKKKIIFSIFAFFLIIGLGCFAQNDNTLRDEDLPYDSAFSNPDEALGNLNDIPENNSENQNVNPDDKKYTARVYYVDRLIK